MEKLIDPHSRPSPLSRSSCGVWVR